MACDPLLSASASKNADPVLMTINGKDVRQSEFEYLYHKNNLQQLAPQSIDEYIEMFIVYKLKVADAEAAGLHQTDAFTKEFNGYCAELSRPYLRDSIVEKRLIEEAYARMATSRKVSHIMLPLGSTYDEKEANRMKIDSIRTAIVNGSADFGEMAVRYSSDRSARVNNGSMGYINVNSYPYPFEKTAWETPVGEISPVIEDAPFGFHIIRVEDERPNPGKVEARHILKLTNGLSEEEGTAKKAQIDSIYNLLASGGDFDAIARAESEDPGSAANGGRLGWFGPGEMVKEFEDAAFGLKDGGISAPFKTAYGYHIVQTLAHRGIGSLAEESERIKAAISRDMRSVMPETERMAQLKAELGVKIDSTGLMQARSRMTGDSPAEQLRSLQADNSLIATVGKRVISIGDVINYIPSNVLEGANDAFTVLNSGLENKINETVVEETRKNLAENNSEYRNLTNEYRDGILLFEISNRNVWERSASDTEGLQKFFSANRAKYTWDKPHYKGYVIFATNDSIAGEAQKYLAANQVENDSLVSVMRANYGRNIKIEKVVTGKGENAIVDNVAFNGERPEAPGRWTAWFGYAGRVIDTPEEANDVRGTVASDYQQLLESEWIKALRKKYKVKLNKKALKALGN